MTRDELRTELMQLRPTIMNVVGFHHLTEDDTLQITPLQRAIYDAHVYAAGVELATRLCRLIEAMEEDA